MNVPLTDLNELAKEIWYNVQWQAFPALPDNETLQDILHQAVKTALRRLFITTGRALSFSNYTITDEETGIFAINYYLPPDEYEWTLLEALKILLALVQANVNNIVSYTTNALSVANADKPYQYISASIAARLAQQNEVFLRMVRYTHLA